MPGAERPGGQLTSPSPGPETAAAPRHWLDHHHHDAGVHHDQWHASATVTVSNNAAGAGDSPIMSGRTVTVTVTVTAPVPVLTPRPVIMIMMVNSYDAVFSDYDFAAFTT